MNFCKFTNETRNGIEDATAHSGQTWIAAVNGTAAGGGYELALACDQILLVDDNSSAVSLPEVPLLGVLPGTGGLTRVIDKRRVRKDRADVFATQRRGHPRQAGRRVAAGRRGDPQAPVGREGARAGHRRGRPVPPPGRRRRASRSRRCSARRPSDGIKLPSTSRRRSTAAAGLVNDHRARAGGRRPRHRRALHELGADFWLLAMTRELDDVILRLRTNELELGTWLLRTRGRHRGRAGRSSG